VARNVVGERKSGFFHNRKQETVGRKINGTHSLRVISYFTGVESSEVVEAAATQDWHAIVLVEPAIHQKAYRGCLIQIPWWCIALDD
jgi:hypothetical protein